jgi:hypothetical protein
MEIALLTAFTNAEAEEVTIRTGALGEIEAALRRAHTQLDNKGRRMGKSEIVERELFREGWRKARVWVPEGLPRPSNDSFDGWKVFEEDGTRFGIAVEIEWDYKRVYLDFLKLWRARRGGQIRGGVIVLRSPDTFHYAVHHQLALYSDLLGDVPIALCALDDSDLADPTYREERAPLAFPMP